MRQQTFFFCHWEVSGVLDGVRDAAEQVGDQDRVFDCGREEADAGGEDAAAGLV